ncbi:MAG: thiamine pyrophosphate-binding protein, partial [Ruegeria sp.]
MANLNVQTGSNTTTAAELAAETLARHGVDRIFGQSLPSALILAAENLGIRQIAYRTENAGGAMADGFARISNRVGVVTAQNGPAATLLVPPLAEAMKVSVPIVALVQEVERPMMDKNAFQELDHFSLFQGCTKWVRRVMDASRIEEYMDAAFVTATTGRPGPVALLLPADLLKEDVREMASERSAVLGHWPIDRTVADPAAIASAAKLIAEARHPVVHAGGGV